MYNNNKLYSKFSFVEGLKAFGAQIFNLLDYD